MRTVPSSAKGKPRMPPFGDGSGLPFADGSYLPLADEGTGRVQLIARCAWLLESPARAGRAVMGVAMKRSSGNLRYFTISS